MNLTTEVIEQMELIKREQELLFWTEESTRISSIEFKKEN